MNDVVNKEIVVIVGPGRSGTSLLTELLSELGLVSVDNVEVTGDQNPNGDFEDREINKLNLEIYKHLGASPNLPINSDFVTVPGIRPYLKKARNIINKRTAVNNKKWGFKDPKTASLLPFWIRACNVEKVTPRFVLAVREPSSVIASFVKNYAMSPRLAELVWLTRVCDTLRHTGGNCFIVHYEYWFRETSSDLASELVSYLKLPVNSVDDVKSVLERTVSKNLNRSQYSGEVCENPFVKKLYDTLVKCSGYEFNRTELMSVVSECESSMKAFSGWWITAQELHQKNLRLNSTKDNIDQESAKEYIENNRKLVDICNNYLEEAEALKSQLSTVSMKLSSLEKEKKELLMSYKENREALNKANNDCKKIKKSKAFSFAVLLRQAANKPWPHIFLFFPRAFKLFLNSFDR